MFSIGDQPNPWIRPIWEALFEGLSQLTQAADDFWRGVQITTPGLMLRFEKLIHKLASRLISDVLVGHAIKLALESEALEVAANQLVQQREYSRLQKAETRSGSVCWEAHRTSLSCPTISSGCRAAQGALRTNVAPTVMDIIQSWSCLEFTTE